MPPYTLGQPLRLEFWKYPEHRLHYWWEGRVAELREGAVLLYMPLGFEFHHESKGKTMRVEHQGRVAFFARRWYSGGPDLDGEGRVLEYYWNVQTPPVFERGRIWQYDLELDVRCKADHTCLVVDEDEFEAKALVYPAEWVRSAKNAVEEVQTHVRERRWPVLPPAEDVGWLSRV